MEVRFTPEQEAELARIARNAGVDTASLVRDAALRLLAGDQQKVMPGEPGLPVWHLGATTALHRRDIYDDAR
jgi:hypothetical protein